jgi:hypothetical protein
MTNALQNKILFSTVSGFMFLTLLLFSSQRAYGEESLIEEGGTAIEEAFDSAESIHDNRVSEAANAVGEFKQKINGLGSAVNHAARDAAGGSLNVEIKLPFILAAFLFIMLMLKFRKKTKKAKF